MPKKPRERDGDEATDKRDREPSNIQHMQQCDIKKKERYATKQCAKDANDTADNNIV